MSCRLWLTLPLYMGESHCYLWGRPSGHTDLPPFACTPDVVSSPRDIPPCSWLVKSFLFASEVTSCLLSPSPHCTQCHVLLTLSADCFPCRHWPGSHCRPPPPSMQTPFWVRFLKYLSPWILVSGGKSLCRPKSQAAACLRASLGLP